MYHEIADQSGHSYSIRAGNDVCVVAMQAHTKSVSYQFIMFIQKRKQTFKEKSEIKT